MLLMILMGGIDTSANMTGLGVLTFLRNPDQLDLLRKNPSLVPGAVEELTRFLSIVHFTAMRLSTGETEFSTRTVPAGKRIIAPLGAANRDPDVFPNPDKFDITRSARNHLGFGSGVHQCLGQAMARMELQEVFGELFRRFPNMQLAVPEKDLVFRPSLVYALEALPIFLHGKPAEGER
jgi:cytochrome P450